MSKNKTTLYKKSYIYIYSLKSCYFRLLIKHKNDKYEIFISIYQMIKNSISLIITRLIILINKDYCL